MEIIVRKDMKRKLEEGKETAYFVRNRPVHPRKISRFIKNHDLSDCHSHMSRKFLEVVWRTSAADDNSNTICNQLSYNWSRKDEQRPFRRKAGLPVE